MILRAQVQIVAHGNERMRDQMRRKAHLCLDVFRCLGEIVGFQHKRDVFGLLILKQQPRGCQCALQAHMADGQAIGFQTCFFRDDLRIEIGVDDGGTDQREVNSFALDGLPKGISDVRVVARQQDVGC